MYTYINNNKLVYAGVMLPEHSKALQCYTVLMTVSYSMMFIIKLM